MTVIRSSALKTDVATDEDIENLSHYLDACDAQLVVADSLYLKATAKVTQYVAAKRAIEPAWQWRHAGAILDICENLARRDDANYVEEFENCSAVA